MNRIRTLLRQDSRSTPLHAYIPASAPAPAAVPISKAAAPNMLTKFEPPIPLPRKDNICWLTALIDHAGSHFTYELTCHGQAANWPAYAYVPESLIKDETAQYFHAHGPIHVDKDNSSRAEATLCDIVGENERKAYYVRRIKVKHGRNRYEGVVHVPKKELEKVVQRFWEEREAVLSIEDAGLQREVERRTVDFLWKAPVKGTRAEVEVWSRDGQSSYQGKARVVTLERKEERNAGREWRYVVLETLVSDPVGAEAEDALGRRPVFLAGELFGESRVGRFVEVEMELRKEGLSGWPSSERHPSEISSVCRAR